MNRNAQRQHGAAALAVAMVLLFGMTLVAFFANRGLIFEQRTSANQYRATQAFETAEAGLEWAVARLNDDQPMAAAPSCSAAAPGQTYAERYLPAASAGLAPSAARSGCSIAANGTTTCRCPIAGNPALGQAGDPRFTVSFGVVATDPWSIEITSFGCTSEGTSCDPASTATADAFAAVRAVYKMRPAIPNAPGAALITGGNAVIAGGANLTVANADVASNGVTVNAGGTAAQGTAKVLSLPGTPGDRSIYDGDASLAALSTVDTSGDIFFTSFFGERIAEYRNGPKTWTITASSCGTNRRCTECGSSSACGTELVNAYENSGARRFWANTDISIDGASVSGTLGSPTAPITLVNTARTELEGNLTAYGLFYSQTASATGNWSFSGSGGVVTVLGAFVSRGNFTMGAGRLDLVYDPEVFELQHQRGLMVRVPGSWRDATVEY